MTASELLSELGRVEIIGDEAKEKIPDAVHDTACCCDAASDDGIETLRQCQVGEDNAGDNIVPAAAHQVEHTVVNSAFNVDWMCLVRPM